jgi:hypothetical protein
MSEDFLKDPLSLFSVKGKTAIVTGATPVRSARSPPRCWPAPAPMS